MSRFDYVKYDEKSCADQELFKLAVRGLEQLVEHNLPDFGESKKHAIEALEVFYMWCGKGIRDKQIARNRIVELQEERKDG